MRRLWIVIACLLLGAVTSVAVAWGSRLALRFFWPATKDPSWSEGKLVGRDAGWWVSARRRPGETILCLDPYMPVQLHGVASLDRLAADGYGWARTRAESLRARHREEAQKLYRLPAIMVPRWVTRPRYSLAGPVMVGQTFVLTHGWPIRCMACEVVFEPTHNGPPPQPQTRWMWKLKGLQPAAQRVPVGLPLRPIPLGLAVDTALFGSGWLAVLIGLSAARRWNRRRRGTCPACGYDLSADPAGGCPECGRGRQP